MHKSKWIPEQQSVWLLMAVVAVCFMGIFAVEISFARIPMFSRFFSAALFYRALCVHVVFAMLIWLVMFLIFLWHHYIPEAKAKTGKLSIALGIISIILISSTGIFDLGRPYLNDYLPVIEHPVFWAGILVFVAAFILSIAKFIPYASDIYHKNSEGQLLFYSMLISVVMLFSVGISYVTTEVGDDLKLYYYRLFWVPGHIQQFLNAVILLIAWHFLARKSGRINREIGKSRWLTLANGLLFLSIFPMLGGFFIDPMLPSFKLITVFSYGIGLGVPVLIHTVYLFRVIRTDSFAFNIFLLSVILYYAGVFIAYAGMKSDLRVTAHYHGVVTALTVSLMGLTYFILKEKEQLKFQKFAKLQPLVFGAGMFIIIFCLFFAGHYGAPRKTFGFSWVVYDIAISYLNILVIGAALSVIGGIMYIIYSLASLVKVSQNSLVISVLCLIALTMTSFRMPEEEAFLGRKIQDIEVFDSKGNSFFLSELLKEKPSIISPIYTKCPTSCSAITANLRAALQQVEGMGSDYQVITFSFDRKDGLEELKVFEEAWKLNELDWKVVSAKGDDIFRFLNSIDFNVDWDYQTGQYEHPNVVMMITPSGKISRYVYGIYPKPNDLKIALLEAKQEKTALGVYEGLLLSCFVYDPVSKTYVIDRKFILMVIAGGIPIMGMLIFVTKNVFTS
ncbi:MAG: SCO family protein [Cytophagaceae bacterium]